ncbi:MAG: cell division protein FtsL [Ruminococcus sp.]|nr:cell division protein FtsL [Ruminococcus sp.]
MTESNTAYSYPEYDEYNYDDYNYDEYNYKYSSDDRENQITEIHNEPEVKVAENSVNDIEEISSPAINASKSGSVISIILISIIATSLLGSVIYTFDRRNTVYNTVTSLNKQLSLAEAENVRLQSELESKMSAKNVEDYAENVLGMKKMDSSQIKYIKIRTDDVVNIPEQEKGIITKIKGFLDACVEYFRG